MAHAYQDLEHRQATISTEKATYKLKQSETSNMLMAVDLSKKKNEQSPSEISLTTHVFVEVTTTQPKDHQIVTYLRQNHDLFGEEQGDPVEISEL